jgi:small subunit ribosomal protein S1
MMVSVGDEVEVVVLGVDVENRKISLGMKQCEPDPWENLETKYRVGTIHAGMVRDLVPFGAFVELEEGIEGLVHISDLSWTRKVRHPGEIVKKGEEINVQILGFDRNERRISLGYKQTQENPWDKLEQELTIRTQVKAKVVRILEKGVVVMLPQDVEGFVPNSHLRRVEKGADKRVVNVDDELNLVVIEFDKEAKKIILSAYEAEKTVEEKEYLEYLKQQSAPAVEEMAPPPEIPVEVPSEAPTESPPTEVKEVVALELPEAPKEVVAPEVVEAPKEELPEVVVVEEITEPAPVLTPEPTIEPVPEPAEEKPVIIEPIEEAVPAEPVEKKPKKRKAAAVRTPKKKAAKPAAKKAAPKKTAVKKTAVKKTAAKKTKPAKKKAGTKASKKAPSAKASKTGLKGGKE